MLKRIFEYIRIFSSEYWYSYSIHGHFQNLNIIQIFEYFVLNIQKLFDGKILEFYIRSELCQSLDPLDHYRRLQEPKYWGEAQSMCPTSCNVGLRHPLLNLLIWEHMQKLLFFWSAIWNLQISVETNIRIFSSKYWYSYSIHGHFQNPNIIQIFEYFGLNIQKLFDGKILEFLRNKDKIWTIFCEQGVDL